MSGGVTEETKFYEKKFFLMWVFIKFFEQNADTSHSGKAVPTNKK